MRKRKAGRPISIRPIRVAVLDRASEILYSDMKRTSVYRKLASELSCGKTVIREAFGGRASESIQRALEKHLKLDDGALSYDSAMPADILFELRRSQHAYENWVRHHDESTFRDRAREVDDLSPSIEQSLLYLCDGLYSIEERIDILRAVEWHVTYLHIIEDSKENEHKINRILAPALESIANLLRYHALDAAKLETFHALAGEFHHLWVPPNGDIWKRDIFSPADALAVCSLHRQSSFHFSEASRFATGPTSHYDFRQLVEAEAQVRLLAKAGLVAEATDLMNQVVEFSSRLPTTAVEADVLVLEVMIARARGEKKTAIAGIRDAIAMYEESLGTDHHYPHSLRLLLSTYFPNAASENEHSMAVEFFANSVMKSHWNIDLSIVKPTLLNRRRSLPTQ